ncbi:hypothetical protein FO519_004993 [Halicephalobus sp. NKZ332]|nr:hypothetical protein FO519_004993 [Halicephalobus sp. NKZ332]
MSEDGEEIRQLMTERESLKCTLLGLQAARKAIEEEDMKLEKEEKDAREELKKFVVERENTERLITAKREQSFNLQTELYEVKAQLAHTRQKSNFQNELIKRFKQLRDQRGCQAKIMEEGVKRLKENRWNIKKREKLALLQESRIAYKHEKDTVRELKQTSEKDMEALEDEMSSPIIDFINNIVQSELTKFNELRNVEKSPHRPAEKRRQSHSSTTPKKVKSDENRLLRVTNSAPTQKVPHTPKKIERKGILKETSNAKRRIPPADPYDFSNLMNDTLDDQSASQTPPRVSSTPVRETREKAACRNSPTREEREKVTPRRSTPPRETHEKIVPYRDSPTEVNAEKTVPRQVSPVNENQKSTPRRVSPTPKNQGNSVLRHESPNSETQEKTTSLHTPSRQESQEGIPRAFSAQETQEKEISFINFASAASPEKMMDLAISSIDAGNDLLNLLGVDTNDGEENGPMFSFLNHTEINSGPFFNFKTNKTNDESSNGGNGFLF